MRSRPRTGKRAHERCKKDLPVRAVACPAACEDWEYLRLRAAPRLVLPVRSSRAFLLTRTSPTKPLPSAVRRSPSRRSRGMLTCSPIHGGVMQYLLGFAWRAVLVPGTDRWQHFVAGGVPGAGQCRPGRVLRLRPARVCGGIVPAGLIHGAPQTRRYRLSGATSGTCRSCNPPYFLSAACRRISDSILRSGSKIFRHLSPAPCTAARAPA